MIYIPEYHFHGSEHDKELAEWINRRLINMMEVLLYEYATENPGQREKGKRKLVPCNEDDMAEFGFLTAMYHGPDCIEVQESAKEFLGLYLILKDEHFIKLTMMQEYFLASVIRTFIERADHAMTEPVMRIPERIRPSIVEAAWNEKLEDDLRYPDENSDPEEYVTECMKYYEDLRYYFDTCFLDADYELMDGLVTTGPDGEVSILKYEKEDIPDYQRVDRILEGVEEIKLPSSPPWNEKNRKRLRSVRKQKTEKRDIKKN